MAHQCPQPMIFLDSCSNSWTICFFSVLLFSIGFVFTTPPWPTAPPQSSNCFDTGPCNDFGRAQLSKRSCGFPGEVSPYLLCSFSLYNSLICTGLSGLFTTNTSNVKPQTSLETSLWLNPTRPTWPRELPTSTPHLQHW